MQNTFPLLPGPCVRLEGTARAQGRRWGRTPRGLSPEGGARAPTLQPGWYKNYADTSYSGVSTIPPT